MAQKQGKSRKMGRENRKRLRKGSPISLYVRGKISFEQYRKQTTKPSEKKVKV